MTAKLDYQGTLGFELVVHTQPNGGEVYLIREDGDGASFEREATLAERVLWDTMAELLEALQGLDAAYCRAGSPLTREERNEDRQRLIAARAAVAKAGGAA